jgi:hypothetical protein
MKIKASKKSFKGQRVLRVGYCKLQYLLREREPFAYSSGVYGWACDYYQMNGFIISTGYQPTGSQIDYAIIEQYDNTARAILENRYTNWETKRIQLNDLIADFEGDIVNTFTSEEVQTF